MENNNLRDSLYEVIQQWLDKEETQKLMKAEGLEDYSDLPHDMTDAAIREINIQK